MPESGDEPQSRALVGPATYPFPDRAVLPWSHVDTRLSEARVCWLCTARAGAGRPPHVTPLWGAWVDRFLYLDGPPTTRWAAAEAALEMAGLLERLPAVEAGR